MGKVEEVIVEPNMCQNEQERLTTLRAVDISAINHDLNSTLSPIKICVEMLESSNTGPLNEKQKRMISTIHRCTDRLESLIRDIVYVYKLELKSLQLSKSELDVQNFMDDCMNVLKPMISEKQIELKTIVDTTEKIYADENMLKLVLVNLVKNSVDFVPTIGGKITIKVEKDEVSNMVFTVEDNGEGIANNDLKKIFEKFYKDNSKQNRKYGGSGLGLTICKGIVEEHGGRIWVNTKHAYGTSFKFTIPLIH